MCYYVFYGDQNVEFYDESSYIISFIYTVLSCDAAYINFNFKVCELNHFKSVLFVLSDDNVGYSYSRIVYLLF